MVDFLSDVLYRFGRLMALLAIVAIVPVGFSDRVVNDTHTGGAPAANAVPVLSTGSLFHGPDGETVAIPEGAPIDTTPVICWTSEEWEHAVCTPEESPTGSRVTAWQDNSPVYGDDEWFLFINDTLGTVEWQYLPDAIQYV